MSEIINSVFKAASKHVNQKGLLVVPVISSLNNLPSCTT